ncbi:ABC transporter ATP-binding protein [Oleidesulfovibrio sp.]|uniref:ABC transporter ATP-binding protein n=1 Tax=Oleidesulfovibrio sp. TaxID=2909707 RepID=UPI003A892411
MDFAGQFMTIRGHVASLLEVGTGFHPELTGRENIYLNGSILGMKRKEIRNKFEEIVSFAEVEKFLDTPVKRYSSGMYVRLAFAVAAHLEPEILIVDEVLAVGDGEFQKKCLGKMDEISKGEGRTILFVSHNMGAVQNLCNKGVVLGGGKVQFAGKVANAVVEYNKLNNKNYDSCDVLTHNPNVFFCGAECQDIVASGDDWVVELSFEFLQNFGKTFFDFAVDSAKGQRVIQISNGKMGRFFEASGKKRVTVKIRNVHLSHGQYHVHIYMKSLDGHVLYVAKNIKNIHVMDNRVGATAMAITAFDSEIM